VYYERLCSAFSGDGNRLKRYQRRKFIEKKIKRTTKDTRSISVNGEEKTIILTILVALVIIGALLVYLVSRPTETEFFSAIYFLDSDGQLENIPKTVVLGENSTFSLFVGVDNQNGTTLDYQVNVTIRTTQVGNSAVEQTIKIPIEEVKNGDSEEVKVEIEINQIGINEIIFELGFINEEKWVDTGNWVNLSIEAIGTIPDV